MLSRKVVTQSFSSEFVMKNTKGFPYQCRVRLQGVKWPLNESVCTHTMYTCSMMQTYNTHTHIHAYAHTYIHSYTHINTYVCKYTHKHTHTQIRTHIHTNRHTHTHTQTHTQYLIGYINCYQTVPYVVHSYIVTEIYKHYNNACMCM